MGAPRLLDLFCCEGGTSTGYHRAGFDVTGVDRDPQPRYPFTFHQSWRAMQLTPPCSCWRRPDSVPFEHKDERAFADAMGCDWDDCPRWPSGDPTVLHAVHRRVDAGRTSGACSVSTDTPSPATPAPTDRGERMSTPTPPQSVLEGHTGKRVRWSFKGESWDGWLVSLAPGTSGMVATVKRDDGEDWVVLARNVEPIDAPAASAPQGDTADVIEHARRVLAESYDGIDPDVETRHDGAVANLAAAGLLAVAASPAVPQARERGELWNVLDWSLWGNGMADTFRDPLADKMIAALTDAEYEQATALIERWKRLRGDQVYRKLYEDQRAEIERLKALSAPAPADDEAAQVERMAAAIAKDDGFDWRSGEWNDVYLSRARAALAALKEGHRA